MDPMENSMFGPGAEDVAQELEDSMLGVPRPHSYDKGKGKQPVKRQWGPAESDSGSDLDVPVPFSKNQLGHLAKKRKLDGDAADTADELEQLIIREHHHPSPEKIVQSSTSKARQISLRDGTPDSISMTSKPPRKKPGPKKHFPFETLELLGLGSGPPSVSGDVTPGISRPASPALTVTSNVVYELDEVVAPLKRAKKVDDAAMLKRVKALEEAQRKVWTNIARRDVAKVPTIVSF
jgi:DNA helicase INO80